MRDRGLGGAATSPSERRTEARPSGGPRWFGKHFHLTIGNMSIKKVHLIWNFGFIGTIRIWGVLGEERRQRVFISKSLLHFVLVWLCQIARHCQTLSDIARHCQTLPDIVKTLPDSVLNFQECPADAHLHFSYWSAFEGWTPIWQDFWGNFNGMHHNLHKYVEFNQYLEIFAMNL